MVWLPLGDLWPFLTREEFRANMLIPPLPGSGFRWRRAMGKLC